MAVYGIGIDMVRIDRIEAGLARWGDRFLEKVFTAFEKQTCGVKKNPASCYAVRFAAKEAFTKALGTGVRAPLCWKDMEIRQDASGKPFLILSERARGFVHGLGVHAWHISLSDDGLYGVAVALLETKDPPAHTA